LPQPSLNEELRVDTGAMLDTGEGFDLSHTLYHIAIIWPILATPETGFIKVQVSRRASSVHAVLAAAILDLKC
jgi:hypothetical protein